MAPPVFITTQQISDFITRAKTIRRLLDNYFVPEDIRAKRVNEFLTSQALPFVSQQHTTLDEKKQSIFNLLCDDIKVQATNFLNTSGERVEVVLIKAKELMNLIINIENYLLAIQRLPWVLGRKVSLLEKARIKGIFLRELRDMHDEQTKRAMRGTYVMVELTGSLVRGVSDYKFIENSQGERIPKPSDYGLPRRYRKLDEELILAQELKAKMSDVDILIVNEVLFDSINPMLGDGWSFLFGEKYNRPLPLMLQRLHQALETTKIGGIRGRWVNYVILRDIMGYHHYKQLHEELLHKIQLETQTVVVCTDTIILDQIISVAPLEKVQG